MGEWLLVRLTVESEWRIGRAVVLQVDGHTSSLISAPCAYELSEAGAAVSVAHVSAEHSLQCDENGRLNIHTAQQVTVVS